MAKGSPCNKWNRRCAGQPLGWIWEMKILDLAGVKEAQTWGNYRMSGNSPEVITECLEMMKWKPSTSTFLVLGTVGHPADWGGSKKAEGAGTWKFNLHWLISSCRDHPERWDPHGRAGCWPMPRMFQPCWCHVLLQEGLWGSCRRWSHSAVLLRGAAVLESAQQNQC